MRLVLDTNVVVSAVLSPSGAPAQLLDLVLADELLLVVEPRVLSEYREVLLRPRLKLNPELTNRLIDTLEEVGESVVALPWRSRLPDQSDEVFLATAKAGQAVLVSGNIRHFPASERYGVDVCTPRHCLDRLR